jgi:hypothetical protein
MKNKSIGIDNKELAKRTETKNCNRYLVIGNFFPCIPVNGAGTVTCNQHLVTASRNQSFTTYHPPSVSP